MREALDRQTHQTQELYEFFALGEISKAEYLASKTAATKQREEIVSRIAELEAALEGSTEKPESEFVSGFQYAGIKQITQEIVADVLKEIRIYPENRLEVVWNYQREFENLASVCIREL